MSYFYVLDPGLKLLVLDSFQNRSVYAVNIDINLHLHVIHFGIVVLNEDNEAVFLYDFLNHSYYVGVPTDHQAFNWVDLILVFVV